MLVPLFSRAKGDILAPAPAHVGGEHFGRRLRGTVGLWDPRPAPERKVERQGISHMSMRSVCGSGAKEISTGGRWTSACLMESGQRAARHSISSKLIASSERNTDREALNSPV